MRLYDDGFQLGKLLKHPFVGPLADLVNDIKKYSYNIDVISSALEVGLIQFPSSLLSSQMLIIVPQAPLRSSGEIDDLVLSTVFSNSSFLPALPVRKAQRIVERANFCELRHEEEASWNEAVHGHLLVAACQPDDRHEIVDYMSW